MMEMFPNDLMKAEENEEDVNELNDVTFGDATVVDEEWEWEKDHEKMAEVLRNGSKELQFQFSNSLGYDHDEEALEMDDNDLRNKLTQLVIDDDEEDAVVGQHSLARKPVDLEELFGPASPPGLFTADELVTGMPNIWGSPIRESRMTEGVGGLKSLLQSMQQNVPVDERGSYAGVMQGHPVILPRCPSVGLPKNAKTVEEIEQELVGNGSKNVWKMREIEGALRLEDVERELKDGKVQMPGKGVGHHGEQHPGVSAGVPPIELPPNAPSPFVRMALVNPILPPGVPPIARSPFPMHGFPQRGPIPFPMLPPLPGQRPSGPNPVMPMLPPHLASNYNYILASRAAAAAAGFAFGPNRQMMPPRMPGFMPHPGMNHIHNRNQRNEHIPPNRQPSLNDRGFPPTSVNPHYLLQHQQQFQQQQMHHLQQLLQQQQQQHGYGNAGWQQPEFDLLPPARRENESIDEYAGLMQQREKDWIIKIQLLQLQTDNPYVDDYYFTCWSIKKMLREKRKAEGVSEIDKSRGEPTLVLPQLAKVETKAYTPVQFEGSLGKLTASSIHNPRQIIDCHLSSGNDHDDGHHLERKRFKELLLEIEKCYEILLDIDDIEKKSLAQPPDARVTLLDQRKCLIKGLYQRFSSSAEDGANGPNRLGLASLLSIHKGLMLAMRVLPLLEKEDAETFCCSLLQKLPILMKKDRQEEVWPRFYQAFAQITQTADLETLVRFSSEINEESGSSKNKLNNIMTIIQNKLGVSVILVLVSRGESIYSKDSPLDLDVEKQRQWCEFVELLANALENLDKDMLVRPLELPYNVKDHFARFLVKRQFLAIEDKLDIVLSFNV